MIPHSKPLLDKSDYDEVLRVLSSGFISQGREVEKFEASLSDLIGVKAGVAVNSEPPRSTSRWQPSESDRGTKSSFRATPARPF